MASCMFKAIAQKAISVLPRSQSWNYWFQKHVTRTVQWDETDFRKRLFDCRRYLETYFGRTVKKGAPLNVLKLGTGWYPVIPVGFYLCGASRVWTVDKWPLLRRANVKWTLRFFADYAERGELMKLLPWANEDRISELIDASRCQRPVSAAEMLGKLRIEVVVGDARHMELEQRSVGFFCSNNVL